MGRYQGFWADFSESVYNPIPRFMPWQDWLDIPFIRLSVRHSSGVVASILLFAGIGWIAKQFVPEGLIRDRIEIFEEFVLFALLGVLTILLMIVLIKEGWKQIKGGWNDTQFLAI
jgi:hypothetical protein